MASLKISRLVSRPVFLAVSFGQLVFMLFLYQFSISDAIEDALNYRFLFGARAALKLDPEFHPKLKIFAYDDSRDLSSPDDLLDVLSAIAKRNPQAFFLDKHFDQIGSSNDALSFVKCILELGVPVYATAFFSELPMEDRKPLHLSASYDRFEALATPSEKSFFAFGPPSSILEVLTAVGHSSYRGDGRTPAAVKLAEGGSLPHIAFVSDSIGVNHVPPSGNLRVNFSGIPSYREKIVSISAGLSAKEKMDALSIVDSGDTVLILTGRINNSSEWVESPHGALPIGYATAAVLNSRMTGKYLREPDLGVVLTLGNFVLGTALGLGLSPLWFFISLLLTTYLIRVISFLGFVYGSVMVPALLPSYVIVVQGIFSFIYKMSHNMRDQILAKAELDLARAVQQKFLPQENYRSEKLDIFGFFKPASECSGDWWAHLHIDHVRHIVVVGDVTGHGVSSALLAAAMTASSELLAQLHRMNALASLSSSEILSHLNSSVCGFMKSDLYCSVCLVDIDLKSGKLIYANAGHIPPFIIRRILGNNTGEEQDDILSFSTLNNPLGVNPDEKFIMVPFQLSPGDKLAIYTDGLTEWFNSRGHRLTPSGLRKMLLQKNCLDAKDIPQQLVEAAEGISQGSTQPDDITIVILDFKS